MRVTRVIAVAVMAATAGLTALDAQSLREASPPAEFPPSSYKGNQYVDSRGCIYIRAGIDGNTTWVPRVSRDRKQVCGYKPTAVAGSTASPQKTTNVEQITIPTSTTQPTTTKTTTKTATTTTTTKTTSQPKPVAAPAAVTASKPRTVTTTKTTTARPTTTTTTAPRTTTTAPAPVAVAPTTQAPATRSGGCSNASAFSQQFINKQGVRCGPQNEAPVTYGKGWDKQSSLGIDPNTRIVPRHVYENRYNTRNVSVPSGYRTVWQDDRLNPHRAERTAQAAVVRSGVMVPSGYRMVEREDDRLNPNRGFRTALGENQTDLIWSRTVPRTLIPFENDRPVITLAESSAKSTAEAEEPNYWRISTRSAPDAGSPLVRTASQSPNESR